MPEATCFFLNVLQNSVMIMLTRLVTVVLQDKWHSTHDKTLSHTSHAHTPAPPTQMDCRLQALRSAVTERLVMGNVHLSAVRSIYTRGPKLGTYSDWGLSSILVINKHLSHLMCTYLQYVTKTSTRAQIRYL